MSRGHGRIERAIIELFRTGDTWTVEDLCNAAYPGLNRIERKHRVAARRAAHKVAEECGVGTYRPELSCGPLQLFVRIGAPRDAAIDLWHDLLLQRRGERRERANRDDLTRMIDHIAEHGFD